MPTCHSCGSTVEEGLKSCPFCGVKIKTVTPIIQPSEIDDETVEIIIKQKAVPIFDEKQDGDTEVLHTPNIEEMESLDDEEQIITKTLDIVPERNYFYWFLLGIISAGIIFLVYLFLNIQDLEKHSEYPKDSRADSIKVNSSQTLFFFLIAVCFAFIPVLWWIYYKKYSSLYYHLRNQKNTTAPFKIPRPVFYMLPLICSHLLALAPSIIGWAIQGNIRIEMPTLFWGLFGGIMVLSIIPIILDYLWQRAFNAHVKTTMARLQIMGKIQAKTTENVM